jgi:hypothetical protein
MKRVVVIIAVLISAGASAPAVLAYDPNAAASYADTWVSNSSLLQNSNYPDLGATDCTNYVSQSLFGGGYPMQGVGNDRTHYTNWWVNHDIFGFHWSFSWTVAPDLLNMLYYDGPGGFPVVYKGPTQEGYYNHTSGGAKGDVLFYDWGAGEGVSHTSIQVANGTDPISGWTGDLVDTHSTDHKHAFWSLQPYNSDRSSFTYITVVHVSASN